jgi:hypothetical protein
MVSRPSLQTFFAGDVDSRDGVRVAVKDLDGGRNADLIVGAGANAGSNETAYLGKNISANGTPPEKFSFDAFAELTSSVFVG